VSEDFYCDEVLSGRTPVEVVRETEGVLAFRHTRPQWPVHVVVVPKAHVPSLLDLDDASDGMLQELLEVVREVAAGVTAQHGGAHIVSNVGKYQESKHLHFHVGAGEPQSG
jgi:histidine triad (HIT) family protein